MKVYSHRSTFSLPSPRSMRLRGHPRIDQSFFQTAYRKINSRPLYSSLLDSATVADSDIQSIILEADSEITGLIGQVIDASPDFIRPLVEVLGGDLADLADLHPSTFGLLRLFALYYLFFTRPNPLTGFLDFYVFSNLLSRTNNFTSRDFLLRGKLGGGNFGQAYEGLRLLPGESTVSKQNLTADQKQRRVVLKRVNAGGEIRSDFLRTGTMAKGAQETGKVESYMCAKISRKPLVAGYCAEYQGSFTSKESVGAFVKGTQWLVWKFESDSTLGDALDGALGSDFPLCLERFVMGSVNEAAPTDKREVAVIKSISKQILKGLVGLHEIGIVHRDLKPENLIVTVEGQVKIIDFGAACDLSTGINFNPLFGMLDPRYSPPEELVLPKNFPRAPSPLLASALAPVAWAYGAPDLFDSYSVGLLLIQMSVPQLRTSVSFRQFNQDLALVDYDMERWRSSKGTRYDLSLLDRSNKAGWDLVTKLVKKRDKNTNRGRLSAKEALGHRFFAIEF